MRNYYVYILASQRNGTLYIGVTNDLIRRVYEHKNGLVEGFTKKYNVKNLIYYEATTDVNGALQREKQLKKWNRKWKLDLIESENPNWKDLSEDLWSLWSSFSFESGNPELKITLWIPVSTRMTPGAYVLKLEILYIIALYNV